MYRITDHLRRENGHSRIGALWVTGRRVFRGRDIGLVWELSDTNTLYTTLKRYVQKRSLFRIQKGLYSLVPVERLGDMELGSALLGGVGYLTTESVLARHGVINQVPSAATFVGQRSQTLEIAQRRFRIRRLADAFLLNDSGLTLTDVGIVASLERAVADMLYFQPKYYFDGSDLVDWDAVAAVRKEIGYQ